MEEHERKSGIVALIGRPNSGKSTLLNRLVGEKVSIVSEKPQTTRNRIRGVLTVGRGQVVFLDTPGIHKPGYSLNRRMMAQVADSLTTADLILLLTDATQPLGSGDRFVLRMLNHVRTPVFLLPNKVDLLRDKSRLLPLIAKYTAEREFADVIPVSAMTGDGIDIVVDQIFERLPAGPFLFPEEALTDQPERVVAAELVREKILEVVGQELPFVTAVVTERWEETDHITRIHCVVFVERASQRPIVIGREGTRIKRIGTAARGEIEKLLGRPVYLDLFVKVREDWRNDDRMLDELGIHA